MKVLVISAEVWQDGTNGGNVLSNIFCDTGFEFAQIYCNPGEPQNNLCTHYYQMTDSMVLRNLLTRKPIGRQFDLQSQKGEQEEMAAAERPNKKFYKFFHNHRFGIFYLARNIAWNCSNWKNDNLRQFIIQYDPDIIFAPCYGNKFMLRLTRYAAELTGKKVISYISDDSYTLKQFNLSPLYWLNRFSVRHQLRKTFPYYSLVYTMTETQKVQCERDFGANMKILLKSVPNDEIPDKNNVGMPIRVVYAGGIYLNRWQTLAAVADAIRKINKNSKKMQLDIYTANEVSKKINALLNDGESSFIHSSVSQKELRDIYRKSDIALHVESFDLKNRLAVRMSFSTKITDCLCSGCAVMAICDAKQGGYVYLQNEDAAICISNRTEIDNTFMGICKKPIIIMDYANKAKKCCQNNHDRRRNSQMIMDDFALYALSLK